MSKTAFMRKTFTTGTGYKVLRAPEALPGLLDAAGWKDDNPLAGHEAYVITQDCNWTEAFRGTHNECFEKLLRIQSSSVSWALTNGGWYIIPASIWDEAIATSIAAS